MTARILESFRHYADAPRNVLKKRDDGDSDYIFMEGRGGRANEDALRWANGAEFRVGTNSEFLYATLINLIRNYLFPAFAGKEKTDGMKDPKSA